MIVKANIFSVQGLICTPNRPPDTAGMCSLSAFAGLLDRSFLLFAGLPGGPRLQSER